MPNDSQLLLDYGRGGDLKSFAALVSAHSTWLLAFLRGLLPSEADAEDAAQETWLRVIRACGSYRGGSVRAYLARVARTVVIDRYRRSGVPTVSLDGNGDEDEDPAAELADDAPTPDARFETRATAEEIRREVRRLPARQREVFLLRVEGELTFEEIAAQLEIPLGTALTWMRRATGRLRQALKRMENA